MIGPRTAEEIKMTIGSAYPLGNNELEMKVRGRDQVAGLPVTKRINSVEIKIVLLRARFCLNFSVIKRISY